MQALATAERQLGIDDIEIPFVGHVLLPALDPERVLSDLRDRHERECDYIRMTDTDERA